MPPSPWRPVRAWMLLWAVALSGAVGWAAAWALEMWPAARAVPAARRLGAAAAWAALWTATTRAWWCRAFYRALPGLLGGHPWPRHGTWALVAGWGCWTLLLWGLRPLAERHLPLPGTPTPQPPLPMTVRAPVRPPADGTDLGCDPHGRPVILRDREANTHVLVVGASGSGKTNALLLLAASVLRRGLPLVFIDGKGSTALRRRLQAAAAACNRPLHIWSVAGPTRYNPLQHGGPTELRDKLVATEVWTEPHYRRAAERYLGEVLAALSATGTQASLAAVADLLEPERLQDLARSLPPAEARRLASYLVRLDTDARSAVAGLGNRLATLLRSEAGLFLEPGTPGVDLLEVAEHGGAALFSLDALRYPGLVAQLGALLLQDLRAVASRRGEAGAQSLCYVILDEFNVLQGTQVLALLNKGREAGFCCVLATQDLADVAAAGGQIFVDQVLANTNVKLLLRQDVASSAQRLAAGAGTRMGWQATHGVRDGLATGRGTLREAAVPLLDPNLLQQLAPHTAVLLRRAPAPEVRRLRLRPAE